jgi:hypothetical protein
MRVFWQNAVGLSMVILIGLLVGANLRHAMRTGTESVPTGEPGVVTWVQPESVPVTGKLQDPTILTQGQDSLIIVALQAADVRGCEDLGRQLRELVGATRERIPVLIVTPDADHDLIVSFLRTERLSSVELFASPALLTTDRDGEIITPAALVVARSGTILRGVSHPGASRNVRPLSFAHELGFLPMGLVPLQRQR